ncbi:MAG: diguanylate cyclase [Lachnospiraceae bacterium]|nr:diguanylate cyclase [Lachnospiraceae bacterium]
MYEILLAVQYAGIIGLFIECWLILKNLKDTLRAYLFLACTATLINNLGYLLEMKAADMEAYITALQLSYAGRVWICFALLLFVNELCGLKIPRLLLRFFALVQTGVYVFVLTLKHHSLYYSDMDFAFSGQFPVFIHKNGIVHTIFFLTQAVYIILGMTILLSSFFKTHKKAVKIRLFTVILAFIIQISFFIIQALNPLGTYDLTMPGFVIGMVFMFVSIIKYNLLGTGDIAREFMVDRLSEGVIAIDNEGDIQYFNEPAKELYPQIASDPQTVIDAVKEAIVHGETITINDRIYTPEENDLLYNNESFGKLYVLIDSTEHFNRFDNEKSQLKKELLTDPLTGFYNRKGMVYYSEKEYLEILNSKKKLFLCVADMNGLKYINDNFGHEQGDRAISELAKIIRLSLSDGDIAFRTGGDEFLIMGPRDTDENVILDYKVQIENLLSEHNKNLDLPYSIDMSYGPVVADLFGEEGELDRLIKLSDRKMYDMKKSRDRYKRR